MANTGAPSGDSNALRLAHPLWSFLTALSGVTDELERARLMTTCLPSLIPCRVSGVALLDQGERTWHLILQVAGEMVAAAESESILSELEPLVDDALQTTTVVTADQDLAAPARLPRSLEELGVHALAVVPMMTMRGRLGAILIGRNRTESFSRDEQLILSTVAEQTAVGLENLRLIHALEERSSDLEQMYNHTPVMMHSLDAEGKLMAVNDHWLRILGYERAEVRVGVWDALSDVGLPTFNCLIADRDTSDPGALYAARGSGCHPARGVALARALTEAAQSRLTFISGSRDDLTREEYDAVVSTELTARANAVLAKPCVRDFRSVPSHEARSVDGDIAHVLGRLHQAAWRAWWWST